MFVLADTWQEIEPAALETRTRNRHLAATTAADSSLKHGVREGGEPSSGPMIEIDSPPLKNSAKRVHFEDVYSPFSLD